MLPALDRRVEIGAMAIFCLGLAFYRDRKASAAVEFAIVFPLLVVFLFGIVCYGAYFWMAHNIQELANDAARAAVAGLTDAERQSLAETTLESEIVNYAVLDPALAKASYRGDSQFFTVSVSYDASSTPFWAASQFLPMPSQTIVRSASIKLGGY
jgi:Flp pilus assembly protein TadG